MYLVSFFYLATTSKYMSPIRCFSWFILIYLFDCPISNFVFVNHAQTSSWNQPVLSNERKVLCPRKQQETWQQDVDMHKF